MTRHDDLCWGRSPLMWLGCAVALALVLAGCSSSGLKRAISADEAEPQTYSVPTVGERTVVSNAEPIKLGGVGLIEGLEGTGGDCKHDEYRAMLADDLRKHGKGGVQRLLNSPNTALVIVEASVPPGAAKGASLDIEVKLPPGSLATSIRGGYLRRCALYNFDFARNLKPGYTGSASLLKGNVFAQAEGPVLMLAGSRGDEGAGPNRGRIWGGGRVIKEYPLALVMNSNSQRSVLTAVVADRINNLFQPGMPVSKDSQTASPAGTSVVSLRVPPQYRLNLPHFLRVAMFVPLVASTERPSKDAKDTRSYRHKLRDDLLIPRKTVAAALRLEALGPNSIPLLREGLKSKHLLVRFASAESLAYLQSASCAEALGEAARDPMLRAYALTALASLPEAVCQTQLRSLIESDLDDETRYGAFCALHMLNPRNPAIAGDKLADSFFLHRVATGTASLVHLTTSKRAEVVLMGDSHSLRAPFSLLAGEFTVTAREGDVRCTVTRIVGSEEARRQCSLQLEDVIRLMADLGCSYSDVVSLVQQAAGGDALSCRVRFDALPQVHSLDEIAASGLGDQLGRDQDLGKVPTLFDGSRP